MATRCEWAGDERRRKAKHGGVGPHSRGASEMTIGSGAEKVGSFSWRSRVFRVFRVRELAGRSSSRSAARRRLGDSAARRLVGSPAQWKRPRNPNHVAARDRTTKPSWGLDAQAGLMRIPAFLPMEVSVKKNIPKKLDLDRGCVPCKAECAAERRDGEEAKSAPHSRRKKKTREAAW